MNIKTIKQLPSTKDLFNKVSVCCDENGNTYNWELNDLNLTFIKGVGVGSAIQEKEVETFVDNNPDSLTSGQNIPTEASGDYSVVLNGKSNASGNRAFAHGNRTIAQGENSHTEGHCTQTVCVDEITNGYAAHAEGYASIAGGTYSHAEGNKTKTSAPNSHAEGYLSITAPEAESAHAEGYETSAEAPASHTEGNKTKTSRAYSHAEGRQTETIGEASHTEGNETLTEGDYAHAEGWMTRAKGAYSHAEGQYTFTYADAAHSEGNNTHAQAPFSHAEGIGTKTNPDIIGQHVEGYYNAESDGVKVIGCGTSDEDRMNAVEVKQDGRVFVKGLGNFDGTNSNEAADLNYVINNKANSGDVYNKTELDNILTELSEKVENNIPMISVTYAELKSLRDNSQLIPGQQYRITDYVTTTVQENTQSAGHQFDVIVIADDINVLNENARAIQHERETYFSNSDLNAWELKYCLDNDIDRFAWADVDNGKGVIYRMIDEFGNDCPYDFKNVKFKHLCAEVVQKFYTVELPEYYYTFTYYEDGWCEASVFKPKQITCNTIKEYFIDKKLALNNIIFIGPNIAYNTFGNYCYNNSFIDTTVYNTFGNYCYDNHFGSNVAHNIFGNYCHGNEFHGHVVVYNIFGNACCYNKYYGEVGWIGFMYNTLGNSCFNNLFGNGFQYNILGNACNNIKVKNNCQCNTFGNACSHINFGESEDNLTDYYRYITIDSGNQFINLNCTNTTGTNSYYQNVRIGMGVNNTITYKTINDSNVGQTYETLYKPANSQTITI